MWHHLGDSYFNAASTLVLRTALDNPNISLTFDGVGGSTPSQQAARFVADTASHNRLVLHNDAGGGEPHEDVLEAIALILATMDSPGHYLFLQSPFRPDQGFDAPEVRATKEANHAEIRALIGEDNYVFTYEAFAAAAISDPENPATRRIRPTWRTRLPDLAPARQRASERGGTGGGIRGGGGACDQRQGLGNRITVTRSIAAHRVGDKT